jgi:hypothetical protein
LEAEGSNVSPDVVALAAEHGLTVEQLITMTLQANKVL